MNFDGDFDVDFQNNNEDEIEVENVGNSNARNNNQGFDDFFGHQQNNAQFAGGDWNMPVGNVESASFIDAIDEEEQKALANRKKEEEERRQRIIKLMNDEMRMKQEYRDKARDFLENFSETRQKASGKRQKFNRQNEEEFIQNRARIKEGKKNPWERVCENIDIKESDYKGTKDVSRMRNVILVRKSDMMKMY